MNPTLMAPQAIRLRYTPAEAFNFKPKAEDVVMECEGKSQRMIFHDSAKLSLKEQTAYDGFRKYLEENRIVLPPGFDDEGRLI